MKTQKAKGISAINISKLGNSHSFFKWDFDLIKNEKDLKNTKINFPAFARPCPTRPRHGFVESKVVKTKKQAISLFEEALKEDKKAEMLLGQVIKSSASSILTGDGVFSIGGNNDGATSGKDSFSVRVAPPNIAPSILSFADIKENPYIEIVSGDTFEVGKEPASFFSLKDKCVGIWSYMVQMRDGPKGLFSKDFVPNDMIVESVVAPSENLLEWETQCANMPKGTVVYHQNGTLTSHAAVHCVINNIPFITSFLPTVGQKISKSNDEASDQRIDSHVFQKFLFVGQQLVKNNHDFIKFSLSVIHNWAYLKSCTFAAQYLGAALGALAWAGIAACLGEIRHISQFNKYKDRTTIYKECDIFTRKTSKSVAKIDFFKDLTSNAFGGELWNNGLIITLNLIKALKNKNLVKALSEANKLINSSHNGGYLLNKFVDNHFFDSVNDNPGLVAGSQTFWFYHLAKLKTSTLKVQSLSHWSDKLPKSRLQYCRSSGEYKNSQNLNNLPTENCYFSTLLNGTDILEERANLQIIFDKTQSGTWRYDVRNITMEIV